MSMTDETDTPPVQGPDAALRILDGGERISNLTEAKELYDALKEALEGEINPASWVLQWIKMVLSVLKALETEERGVYYRAWCYSVLYGALDMGTPPTPRFSGSLQGPDQDALDAQNWQQGVSTAQQQLADGADGLKLRNRTLLRVARNGSDPFATLKEMYAAACDATDDSQLKEAYSESLGWPQPTGA
jgi:hypothetical protein